MKHFLLLWLTLSATSLFAADGYLARSNNAIVIGPGGAGGSQTPLTSDINAGGFQITNAGTIVSTNITTQTNSIGTIILTNVLSPDTLSSTSGVTSGMGLTINNGTNKWATLSTGNFIANTNGSWVGTISGDQLYATQYLGGSFIATNVTGTNIFGLSYFTNGLYTGGTNGGSIALSNTASTAAIDLFGPNDYWFMTNETTAKTISATNGTITAFSFVGNGAGLTSLPAGSESATNSWTTNTAFAVCPSQSITNFLLVSGANTACGVTGILNAGTATERTGQLLIIASGNITFTNPASIHASDFLTTRVITNANNCFISFDVWPGLATNMLIVQTK